MTITLPQIGISVTNQPFTLTGSTLVLPFKLFSPGRELPLGWAPARELWPQHGTRTGTRARDGIGKKSQPPALPDDNPAGTEPAEPPGPGKQSSRSAIRRVSPLRPRLQIPVRLPRGLPIFLPLPSPNPPLRPSPIRSSISPAPERVAKTSSSGVTGPAGTSPTFAGSRIPINLSTAVRAA